MAERPTTEPGFGPDCHRFRPLLGMAALKRLDPQLHVALQAHLDGCRFCRQELGDLAVLRPRLLGVDPSRLGPLEPATTGLREVVFSRLAQEGARGRRARIRQLAAAVSVAAAVLAGVAVLGPPATSSHGAALRFATQPAGVRVQASAADRPWGTQLVLSVSGLPVRQYEVWLERADGSHVPAGTFIGQGPRRLEVQLASAMHTRQGVALGVSAHGSRQVLLRAPLP